MSSPTCSTCAHLRRDVRGSGRYCAAKPNSAAPVDVYQMWPQGSPCDRGWLYQPGTPRRVVREANGSFSDSHHA